MKFTAFVVFVCCSFLCVAEVKDNRDALPAELVAKIAALPVDQQFQLLVSGPDTEATVALVELTRDGATTLANYDRLMAELVNAKGELDTKLLRAVNSEVLYGYSDRRGHILARIIICVRDAPDRPERRRVFDHFLNYFDTIIMTSQSRAKRIEAFESMSKLVFFRGDVIPEQGVDRLLTSTKRVLKDPDQEMKTSALYRLAYIGGWCADYRQECERLISMYASSPKEEAEWREQITTVKVRCQQYGNIQEKTYREAQAHPVEIVTDMVNGKRNHPGLKFAIEIILADHNLLDKNYDLLLQYALKADNTDVLRTLSHSVSESAGDAEKKRADDLLKIYEKLYESQYQYECIDGLRAMLIGGFHKTGFQLAKEGLLPLEPVYQRKRILAMLIQLIPDTRCREKTISVLGSVAWIDAETAQIVLTELEKCLNLKGKDLPHLEDVKITGFPENPHPSMLAIIEAQAAVDYYAQKTAAQKTATQTPPIESPQTPVKP